MEQQEVIEEMKNPRKLFECDDVVVIIGDEVIGELKEFDLFIDRKAGPIY